MNLSFRPLERKDYRKAIGFAVTGMHFERYLNNKTALYYYGKYFLYMELQRATKVIAAYEGEKLKGLLLAVIKGEPKLRRPFWENLYVTFIDLIMRIFIRDGEKPYTVANKVMFTQFAKQNNPDGEICFLAVDPKEKGKGIGSALLEELTLQEQGKQLYLYTDSNCNYQFYEHRGFIKRGERVIRMNIGKTESKFICFLYSLEVAHGSKYRKTN